MAVNISFSPGNDIIVPTGSLTEPGNTVLGGGGDDTYIITNLVGANTIVNIVDSVGKNTIQLVDGLKIASSQFTDNAVELTLSNNARVRIANIGATNFSFELGANLLINDTAPPLDFSQFASSLGVPTLPSKGQPPVSGSTGIVVGAPTQNAINITKGGDFTATAGVDVFLYEFAVVSERATTTANGGAAKITGFNPAQDILQFDGPSPLTTAQFLNTPGVIVAGNPFGNNTSFFFDPNPLQVVGSVTVFGIVDPNLGTLNVQVI